MILLLDGANYHKSSASVINMSHPSFFPSPHHPILIHSIINSYEPGHHNVSQICLLLSISSTDILSQVKVSFCLDFL